MLRTSPGLITCLNTGIFPATVSFCNGLKYDEILKYYEKIGAYDWKAGIEGEKHLIDSAKGLGLYRLIENPRTGETKHLYYIILSKPFDFSDYDYVVLAHEIVHICQYVSEGIFDRNKEREAEAYLHSHLMKQCLEALRTPVQKRKTSKR